MVRLPIISGGGHIMSGSEKRSRREFLEVGLTAAAAMGLGNSALEAQESGSKNGIPIRPLGKTGAKVSILCLGGWHIGSAGKDSGEDEAIKIMHRAIDEGITFFDNAWDYHDGYSEQLMGKAIQ